MNGKAWLIALACLVAVSLHAENQENGKKALGWLFAARGSWVAESDPAKWTEKLWARSGLGQEAWQKAIEEWSAADPTITAQIEAGRSYRLKYFQVLHDEAEKQIASAMGPPSPALKRMINEYAAFAASQRRMALGKPTEQWAENRAHEETDSLRQWMEDEGRSGDLDLYGLLRRFYRKQFGREKRRAEETQAPAEAKGSRKYPWEEWKRRNQALTDAEILLRFRAALQIARKEMKVKAWAGWTKIKDANASSIPLRINWQEKRIETADGKPLKFRGDAKLVKELSGFLSVPTVEPAGAPVLKRDGAWTALRKLRLESGALIGAVGALDKVTEKVDTRQVLAMLMQRARNLSESISPEELAPLKKLAYTPGTPSDGLIEAAIWDGYRQSPKYFKRRSRFFRISFPLREVVSRQLVVGSRLKKWAAIGLMALGLGLGDQYQQHREAVNETVVSTASAARQWAKEHLDPRYAGWVPGFARNWLRGFAGNGNGLDNDQLSLPSDGFGENSPLPPKKGVIEVIKTPHQDYGFLTVGTRGFSSEEGTPYSPAEALKAIAEPQRTSPNGEFAIRTKFPFKTENGKLLVAHYEGFLLKEVTLHLQPKGGGEKVDVTLGGSGSPLAIRRSQKDYYIVDFKNNPGLKSKYDLKAIAYDARYQEISPRDYFQEDLKISDPERVAELARHFEEAGFGRIAEGLKEEARWMKEMGYSLYPEDIGIRIEAGNLYAQVPNPKSNIKVGPGNLFHDLLNLAVEEHACTQCASTAEIVRRAFRFLYAGRPVQIRIRTVLMAGDGGFIVPSHAQVELFVDGSHPKVIVDATATKQDPRNDAKEIPKDDVLHSPGQDTAFDEDRLPSLKGQKEPVEAQVQRSKKEAAPAKPREITISAREEDPHAPFTNLLDTIERAIDHRYRWPDELELEEKKRKRKPKPPQGPGDTGDDVVDEVAVAEASSSAKPKALDPRIKELLEDLAKARKELLEDPTFQSLPAKIRLQTIALPLSHLVRGFLLGEVSREALEEKLRELSPEYSLLRNRPGAPLQYLLREITADQRVRYEKIVNLVANRSPDPVLQAVGNPVMMDKVLKVLGELEKQDIDELVSPRKVVPPGKAAKMASCLKWLGKWVPKPR